jgi:hypothetical protein
MTDHTSDKRSPLKLVTSALGLVIGAGAGACLAAVVAGAISPPPRDLEEALSPLMPAVFLGLPVGGFIGWRLGLTVGQYIRGKVGKREGPAAAWIIVIFTFLLLGWLLMEFYGSW